jgi:hypothetical protein
LDAGTPLQLLARCLGGVFALLARAVHLAERALVLVREHLDESAAGASQSSSRSRAPQRRSSLWCFSISPSG